MTGGECNPVVGFGTLIRTALAELAARRPVFHSEADFQHELAVQIARLDRGVELRLERPVRVPGARPINLDILLRRGGVQYALELKYITARLEVSVGGEEFMLRSQSAQDLRRYDILKDVMRIETLIEAGVVAGGMSITISNDRGMWSETRKIGPIDAAFRLHHGRTLTGSLTWGSHAAPGTVRGREAALVLGGTYALEWSVYSQVNAPRNGDFRMLIAEVGAEQ
ncbi:hypothetical protein [Homoserinimonas sp. OAct 916]|uniref:hypothetical protein n=1 Tax=Homoserinimonas sp. OAct 916 TaxID=2211450 RepID=UPI000DBE4898|nr:hypothetical protein [Homoserinimonas sp. OAct 916]